MTRTRKPTTRSQLRRLTWNLRQRLNMARHFHTRYLPRVCRGGFIRGHGSIAGAHATNKGNTVTLTYPNGAGRTYDTPHHPHAVGEWVRGFNSLSAAYETLHTGKPPAHYR